MTTSEMVRKLSKQRHVSLSELARRVGQSPQNFSKKLQRETLTLEELNEIANALGVSFEQSFVLPGGDRITTNYSEESADVLFVDEFDMLLSAMTEVYPLCIFSNLTSNTYHIFEYDNFPTKKASVSGNYDELVRVGSATVPDAVQSREFAATFDRKHLLDLYAKGQKSVMLRHEQNGDDGVVRWMETTTYFRRAKGSGDILTVTTAKCIDEDVRMTWNKRLTSTLAEDFEVIYLINPETGSYTIERLSDKYAAIIKHFKRTNDFFERMDESIDLVVHPEDREMMYSSLKKENILGRLVVTPVFYIHFRCLVDSVVSYYEMKVAKADDKEFGNKVVIGVHDRSEVETAKLLEKENVSVREALANDYSSVFYVDAATNQCTAYMFDPDFTDRFGKMLSRSAKFATVLSLFVNNFIHPDDRATFFAAFDTKSLCSRLQETKSISFITRKLSSSGFRYNEVKIIRVGEPDDIKGVIIGTSDNDEMICSSLAMEDLNEKALAVTNTLASSYEAVLSVNLANGDAWVCSISEKLKASFGDLGNTVIPIAAVVEDVYSRMDPEDVANLRGKLKPEPIRQRLAKETRFSEGFRVTAKGETRYYQLTIGRFGDGSDPDRIILSCLDRTEEMEAAVRHRDELTKARDEACEASRAKTDLFLSISHELRTPMNAVLGYTEMAQRHLEDKELVDDCLDKAHVAESQIVELINKLMDVGSLGAEGAPDASVEQKAEKIDPNDINVAVLAGKRVLVVDDNALNREIACEVLKEYDMITEPAECGEDAVAMFSGNATGYYDFILMDIQMPGIDGYEATRRIRAEEKGDGHIPVIALTANIYPGDLDCEKESGMDAHIAKPVDIGLLLKTLCDMA